MESKKRNDLIYESEGVSSNMVKEDLWDLGEKWKTLAKEASTDVRPDETKLDEPHYVATPSKTNTEPTILERLAGDKSIASFRDTFGREEDSDDERAEVSRAAHLAANPPDLTGAQFEFSPEQVAREHEKANQTSESDGRSMSTAGKTTDSTRLKLKIAQEQIEELQIALRKTKKPTKHPRKKHPERDDEMEIDEFKEGSKDTEESAKAADQENDTSSQEPSDVSNFLEEAPTAYQLLGAALAAPLPETIYEDSDAMEEDEHEAVYIGTLPPLPSSTESSSNEDPSTETSSSSSSSASSDDTHDTQELAEKLRKNQYHALLYKTHPKKSTKTDDPSGSQDSASHQSSGQESGSAMDHTQADPSANTGVTLGHAGSSE
jgi:hypothetical protein